MRLRHLALLAMGLLTASIAWAALEPMTDAQVKQLIIADSIANYPGNCPCPYNVTRNGSRCGGRSAYSRPGGRAPLCYPEDVTARMVADYRDRHGIPKP